MRYGVFLVFTLVFTASHCQNSEAEQLVDNGKSAYQNGDPLKSFRLFNEAIVSSDKNSKELCETYYEIGLFYADNALHDLTLNYYYKALEQANSIGDKNLEQKIYNSVGGSYYNRMYYLEAKKHWEKSAEINQEINNNRGLSSNLNNLGEIERLAGNYTQAIPMYTDAYHIKEKIGDSSGLGTVLNNLADCYFKVGKLDSGRIFLERSYSIAEKLHLTHMKQYVCQSYGDYYKDSKDYENALSWYQRALTFTRIKQNPDNALYKNIYSGLSYTHKALGNIDSSLFYQTKLNKLEAELFEQEKHIIQSAAEVQADMVKKEKKISDLEDEVRSTSNVSYSILAVVIILLAGILLQQRRIRRLQNK